MQLIKTAITSVTAAKNESLSLPWKVVNWSTGCHQATLITFGYLNLM